MQVIARERRSISIASRVIAKSGLMALGFLLLLLITQRHYSHPGSTGSMQAAKARKFAYRLDFISASYAAAYHLHKLFKHLLLDML